MIFPPVGMGVPISDPIPKQLSEVDIVRSNFALERLKMERKYKMLQEMAEKLEKNARVHEHKARKITEGYTKVKGKNENLYMANKKLWVQVKDIKIGRFFGTQWREGEASQTESNHWQTQATKAQTKAGYWKSEHFMVSEELVKCHKSRG